MYDIVEIDRYIVLVSTEEDQYTRELTVDKAVRESKDIVEHFVIEHELSYDDYQRILYNVMNVMISKRQKIKSLTLMEE